jgi:hypothetical protein
LTPDRPEILRLTRLLEHKPLTLRDYYAIGEQLRLLSEDPAVAIRGSGWKAEVARLVGQSEPSLNKCLQFRDCYAEDQLPDLERLSVGWAYLTVALAVKGVRKRHKLLRRAREEGWNGRELQRAVQRLRGSRRGGGRHRRSPKGMGLLADVSELTIRTESRADYCERVWAAGQQGYATELDEMSAETREGVRRHLAKAVKELKRLRKQCGDALEGLKALAGRLEVLSGQPGGESMKSG